VSLIVDHAFDLQKFESEENNSYIFQYGPALGTHRYRKHLAEFLSRHYQSPVDASDLVLTGGATSGLLLILSTLINHANGVVFLDEVTYMIALEGIQDFPTLKIVPVKLNDDGVDIKDLEEKLIKFKPIVDGNSSKLFNACYYTIPTYHNPTGIVFSEGNSILKKILFD
jgi:DNA-binding transcriptional MocR family regulator